MINNFPVNCILLEWSEEQQDLHFNEVKKGKTDHAINTYGYSIIHICNSYNEAILIADYIMNVIKGATPTKDGRFLKTNELIRQIKRLIKFTQSYNKLIKQ